MEYSSSLYSTNPDHGAYIGRLFRTSNNQIARRHIIMVTSSNGSQYHRSHDNVSVSDSFVPNIRTGSSDDGKLWQGLVAPIVLSCTLLVIILWSRQASLVFIKDTLVMLFILGLIFVIMSGVAFWLAKEKEPESTVQENTQCHHETRDYPSHSTSSHLEADPDSRAPILNRCFKCDKIAFIDSKPPEYYTALKNSVPIDVLFDNHQVRIKNSERSSDERDTSPPPSYGELDVARYQHVEIV